jgi:hypothetical protein
MNKMNKIAPALVLAAIIALGVSSPAQAQYKAAVQNNLTANEAYGYGIQLAQIFIWGKQIDAAVKINDRNATSNERTASIYICGQIAVEAQRNGGRPPEYCGTPSSSVTVIYNLGGGTNHYSSSSTSGPKLLNRY